VGFFRPHTPFVAPKKYFDLYPLEKITLPEIPKDLEFRFLKAALIARKPEQETMTDRQRKEAIQGYYAAISFLDAQVGKVIDSLNALGLANDTLIVFVSDHGYHLGEKSLWQKRTLFDQAGRVPLIFAGRGVPTQGGVSPRNVELVDLYPTIADLSGLPLDPEADGVSLRPLLNDPRAAWDRPAYTEMVNFGFRGQSVRTGKWRFSIWNRGQQGLELYDIINDPDEMNNRAGDPRLAGVLEDMGRLAAKFAP
jgi:uncharacterized sulfatase